jgi:predicted metal-dependent phosphoesterase TrpH/Ser/Thr protein kinase RdoA (MazF antagonist)
MIVETHCHTSEHSSCSRVAAVDLVRRAREVGIHAIVLTDHHYQWSVGELADLRRRARVPRTFQILAGQEIETRDFGHVLVYGAPATIPAGRIFLQEIREQNPTAALIWAHPYRDKNVPAPAQLRDLRLDAVEIFTSNYSVLEATHALRDWHAYKFTATAGTDTHALSYVGSYPTVFDHPFDSMAALAAEIKAGRCRPYFKEVSVLGGTSSTGVTELTIGPEEAGTTPKVIVRTFGTAAAWSEGQRSQTIAEQLYEHGFDRGTYRVARPLDKDPDRLLLIEERVCGESLFEVLVRAGPADKAHYLERAAGWLSKLHSARLRITPAQEHLRLEPERLEYYLKSLIETGHRRLGRVREIKERVLEREMELLRSRPEILVQGHGDYHARNLFIGRATPDGSEHVTAIDFGSSYQLPRAFDVGTFLAQYINMFFHQRDVQQHAPADIFLQTYLHQTRGLEPDFLAQVDLYKARTCLSILYYLTKIGMGSSENFWRILVEAERSLAAFAVARRRPPTRTPGPPSIESSGARPTG